MKYQQIEYIISGTRSRTGENWRSSPRPYPDDDQAQKRIEYEADNLAAGSTDVIVQTRKVTYDPWQIVYKPRRCSMCAPEKAVPAVTDVAGEQLCQKHADDFRKWREDNRGA